MFAHDGGNLLVQIDAAIDQDTCPCLPATSSCREAKVKTLFSLEARLRPNLTSHAYHLKHCNALSLLKVIGGQIRKHFWAFMWFTVRIFKSWGKRVLYSFTNCFLFSLQFFQICSVCNCFHSILCLCSPYNPSFWSITKLCLCHSMYLLPVPSISFINYQIFTFLCIPLRFFALLYIVLDFSVFLCILHLIF